jgi:hypothetical protein
MQNWLLRYAGLTAPYRFERLLAVLAAGLVAIVVALTAVALAGSGELIRHTPRETYFLYLGALVLAGVALAPWPRLATLALSLAVVEYGLGIGSLMLKQGGYADSDILADNHNEDLRFKWHPLLQATPIPSITVPVVLNSVSHNSEGLRGRERDAATLAQQSVIAVFGGSTTYDIGVTDGETWADGLEAMLGAKNFAILNHGVPGYTTVEHVVQTAFYQDAYGIQPRCALYYVGWNDLRMAHVPEIDPGYARLHLRSQIDSLKARRFGASYTSVSPLFTLAIRWISLWTDTARPARVVVAEPRTGNDPVLDGLYRRNVHSISRMNRDRGVRTIWVGQILNVDELENGKDRDGINGWIPLIRNRDVWPALTHLNDVLQREAALLEDTYVDVPVADFGPEDFYDNGHFLAPGSRKFAAYLAPSVAQACR